MTKETTSLNGKNSKENLSEINLIEAQLLSLQLPEQYDPLLQQSGPKLHRFAQLCKLGLCRFK